jgi:hypothetical protein
VSKFQAKNRDKAWFLSALGVKQERENSIVLYHHMAFKLPLCLCAGKPGTFRACSPIAKTRQKEKLVAQEKRFAPRSRDTCSIKNIKLSILNDIYLSIYLNWGRYGCNITKTSK